MKRCVIVGAAPIENLTAVRAYIKNDDFIVACDGGLYNTDALGVTPDLIVGDFDSHPTPSLPVETIALPCEKDDTDTVFAVREAEKRGYDDFLLLGVVGGRLDHTLGNVSILLYLDSRGHRGKIVDDFGEAEIVSRSPAKIGDEFSYFSLLAVSGAADGVTIKNAKYPLEDGRIESEYQYGISNEVIPGCEATVTVRSGKLLLCRIR